MDEEHSGFNIDIKPPARDPYVACLVVTPKLANGHADSGAKVERHIGREKAVQIAYELLESCGASEHLLGQVRDLSPASNGN